MNNFQIKERICELVKLIYEDNGVGGALHIVLDDDNIENHHIEWCLKETIPKINNNSIREIYEECAKLLLKLSYSSRKRLMRRI